MARNRVAQLRCGLAVCLLGLAGCDSGAPGGAGGSGSGDLAVGAKLPGIADARALSNHYVEVVFSGAANAAAMDPSSYSIVAPDGSTLEILDVLPGETSGRAILATRSQTPDTEYVLTAGWVDASEPTDGDDGAPGEAASFASSSVVEPTLMTAIALTNTTVLLTFDEEMEEIPAETESFYRIADPDLDIFDADRQDGDLEHQVIVTTSSQQNELYTVKTTNQVGQPGNMLINPEKNTATFHGIAPNDSDPPTVLAALATSAITVLVSFSEPVGDDAAAPSKYVLAPALIVLGAELSTFKNQVLLTTLPMTDGQVYDLLVNDVRDRKSPDGNLIVMDGVENHAQYTYDANAISGADPGAAAGPPRVVGAISLNNSTVIVTFSKPMGPSAEQPEHYQIIQEGVQPESGILRVTGAIFLNADPTVVALTTLAQNEVIYELIVTNVKDLQGNQLAPQELLVDPTRSTFRGTPPSCPLSCNNGAPGLDSNGLCVTDADCGGDADTCQAVCSGVDTDGDGLPDHIEQRGWIVTIELTARDGLFDRRFAEARDVTSDPLVVDTDGDGLSDFTERELATDPREPDTDGDGLTDEREFNLFFSSATDQDTDEDQLDDYLEVTFYKTSPILADTDGDGLDDDTELLSLNRDPRVADLPKWVIDVGDLRLQIDERYTFVDSTGETVTEVSNTTTTLAQSRETSLVKSDTTTWNVTVEAGFMGGVSEGKPTALGSIKATGGWENVTQTDRGSVQTAQEAYERSLSKGREFTKTREVTREVFGASIDVPLTIRLADGDDLAFSITNLEISILQMGRDRTKLIPIATLIPNATLLTGEVTTLNIGPFVPERGPIIMGTQEVFPSLVEELLRAPRGPIIIPSNFDIVDEFGRNFSFASQETNDRTASLIVDFGDGTVERFQVAIAGGLDDQGFAGPAGEFVGFFDERGRPNGIPMDYALQDILGFEKDRTTPDSIVAGKDGLSETFAAGDDIQVVNPGLSGFDDRRVIVSAGDDGILQTVPNSASDDQAVVTQGYATSPTCDENTEETIIDAGTLNGGNGICNTTADGDDVPFVPVGNPVAADGGVCITAGGNGIIDTVPDQDDERRGPGNVCDVDSDCDGAGTCTGRQTIRRFKNSLTGDQRRFWAVFTDRDVPVGTDFGQIQLQARMIVVLAFIQDVDRDGLSAREEFSYGTSDRAKDTDTDGLSDFAEIRDGWTVRVQGEDPFTAYPDPRLSDSDLDGVSDAIEFLCGTDPRKRDSDDDGISDFDELNDDAGGFAAQCNVIPPQNPTHLDPLNPDSDGDGLLDGIEPFLCDETGLVCADNLDPTDAGDFLDTDEDGVTNAEEAAGWTVEVELCNNTCSKAFNGQCNDSGSSFCSNNSFFAGDPCNTGSDCDSPDNPECIQISICSNNIGLTCADDTDCDFGTCVSFSCTGADNFCISDSQCIGTCLTFPGFCNDASLNAGDGCTTNGQCDPYPSGNCQTPSQCDLGTDCADCGPRTTSTTETSDPTKGDTDFDGLPDLLEKILGTNPNTADTDGDGLLDFDEFANFGLFFPLNFQHEGFFLNDAGSQQIGTDPSSQDTDGDRLSDNFERLAGWRVLSIVDNVARDVNSSPLFDDSDFDQLDDLDEFLGADGRAPTHNNDKEDATDPTDPDTDGDSRLDSTEIDVGSDPLLPDIFVTVSIERFSPLKGPEDGSNNKNEWSFDIRIQRPLQGKNQSLIDDQDVCGSACGGNACHTYWKLTDRTNIGVNRSLSFDMPLGDPIVIDVAFREIDECNSGVSNNSCIFIEERIVTTNSLLDAGGLHVEPFVLQGGDNCDIGFTIKFLVDGPTSGN